MGFGRNAKSGVLAAWVLAACTACSEGERGERNAPAEEADLPAAASAASEASAERTHAAPSADEPAVPEPRDDATDDDGQAEGDAERDPEGDGAAMAVPTDTRRALEALGYVPTTPTNNPEDRGVTRLEAGAHPGLNLYSSRHRASALLIDMEGRVLHRWEVEEEREPHRPWMHVEPRPDGSIFAITKDHDLAKHDWASNLIWRRRMRAHHDLAVHADGRLFVLVRGPETHTFRGEEIPLLTDGIAVLSPDGELQRRVPLFPLLRGEVWRNRLERVRERAREASRAELLRPGGVADVLHVNSIDFLHRAIPGVAPRGAVLLSSRSLSRVVILSPELDEVLWIWGASELQGQHDATQLDDGHLLIFDNGSRRGSSRALEMDPTTGEIVWTYDAPDLFSRLRGGAQALPNGNVLITESDRGHVIEVTREGELVWELWNPDVRGRGPRAERAVIYRLNRFPRSFFAPLANAEG
jgi:hypothetical protein